jgi:integrase
MGLYKRGKVWWVSFVYQGKYYRKSTETEDRKLAQRIYDKVKGEVAEGKWFERLPGEDKTFENMTKKFEQESIPKRSHAVYISILKNLLKAFKDYPLTSITPNAVNKFKKDLKDRGEKPTSINQKIRILKRMFNVATTDWEWFKDNPIRYVHLEREGKKRDRWITREEEEIILSYCPGWLKEIVIFDLNTGLRISELCNLCIPHVDLSKKTISIIESKNNEPRIIPLNQSAYGILKEKLKIRFISCDHAFQLNGKPIKKHIIGIAFRAACLLGGIGDLHFHDLRHTFATRLVQTGVDLYRVQKLLGHKSPSMTQRYAHHYSESLRGSVEILDNITKMAQSAVTT